MARVEGQVAAGFEPVREAFERCFAELGEEAASFAGYHHGELVADLRGGGFEADSLVNTYSVGKALSAFCVLVLADRGEISIERPMASYWPEFAAAGKAGTTVREMLAHRSGLVALREPLPPEALFDWELICARLAEEEPWFEPGTANGESILFYGHLCGELIRRVDGRTLGAFWREEVAEPWGIDFHFGLGEDEIARTLPLRGGFDGPSTELAAKAFGEPRRGARPRCRQRRCLAPGRDPGRQRSRQRVARSPASTSGCSAAASSTGQGGRRADGRRDARAAADRGRCRARPRADLGARRRRRRIRGGGWAASAARPPASTPRTT